MRPHAVVLALFFSGAARGDTAATARALFDEGRDLMDEGKTALACAKLAESARLWPRIPNRLALAACWERLGRTASAWSEFREVAAMASKAGDSEWTREAYALERVHALEKKLVRLTVTVPEPTPGLVVRRNDDALTAAQIGVAVPVDPGEILVSASAPGYETWSAKVVIGREPVTSVAVPVLKKAPPPPVSAPPPVS